MVKFCRQTSVKKKKSIKFYANTYIRNRDVPCGETEGRTVGRTDRHVNGGRLLVIFECTSERNLPCDTSAYCTDFLYGVRTVCTRSDLLWLSFLVSWKKEETRSVNVMERRNFHFLSLKRLWKALKKYVSEMYFKTRICLYVQARSHS